MPNSCHWQVSHSPALWFRGKKKENEKDMETIETLLINGFIALMLFILWAWDLPPESRMNRLAMKLRLPVQRLGLFHSWRLFSPDPKRDNYRLQFKLYLADGSVVAIEPEYLRYPCVQRQSVPYRWTKMKGALLQPDAVMLRTSVCKYVAAEYVAQLAPEARLRDKQPVKVEMVRWRQSIAPFGGGEEMACEPYKRRVIYTQMIHPAALTAQVTARTIDKTEAA